MSFWRLKIRRADGETEIFDLHVHKKILAGDNPNNQICLETIDIPFEFKLLYLNFKKQLILRLTNEVLSSLKGGAKERTTWKTRLYSGKELEVVDPCEFQIGDVHFEILRQEEVLVPPTPREIDPATRKQWLQSTGMTVGVHAAAILLIFLMSLIPFFRPKPPEVIQQVSIVEVKKLFQKTPEPTPPPAEEQPQAKPEDVKAEKAPPEKEQKETAQANASSAEEAHHRHARPTRSPLASAKAPGKKGVSKPRNISSMGLLALQTTVGNAKLSMKVDAPRTVRVADATNTDIGLGTGNASFGVGSGNDDGKIAKLESISGKTYRGGLAGKMSSRPGAAIHLARKEIEVRGGLDPAVIREVIEERLSEVRYCYETTLLKHTNLGGKIKASWTILADGSVANVTSASDDIKPDVLHPCVRARIQNWKFPQPKGGGVVHVKYPFIFSPIGG